MLQRAVGALKGLKTDLCRFCRAFFWDLEMVKTGKVSMPVSSNGTCQLVKHEVS